MACVTVPTAAVDSGCSTPPDDLYIALRMWQIIPPHPDVATAKQHILADLAAQINRGGFSSENDKTNISRWPFLHEPALEYSPPAGGFPNREFQLRNESVFPMRYVTAPFGPRPPSNINHVEVRQREGQ